MIYLGILIGIMICSLLGWALFEVAEWVMGDDKHKRK